ncbi:MAG: tRNA dihydrouridine synthase DusB [Deltaproteobacteria bacterium]|nr:tRNA dihydrouridine synthase DusB [Deltaproteobacteria bacterium]
MLKIGSLQLANWLIMAPMAGITNLPFRMMVKRMGAALVTTEMISAKGLVLRQERTLTYLKSCAAEKPLSVQLFGSDPAVLRDAAQIAIQRGAEIIDINLGCPVKKVVKTGAGAALLREPRNIENILTAVRKVCTVPLTVKVRAGWRPGSPDVVSVARLIENCGADAITIHPRFAFQGYSGRADWSIIGKLKDTLRIPVIGNGDILRPSDAFNMRKETHCDGVMIGRAAIGNPWIFKQILLMEKGAEPSFPSIEERKSLIMEHFEALSAMVGGGKAARIMRGLLLWYTKGLPFSSNFRGQITAIKDMESLVSTMHTYFSSLEERQS